MSEPTMTREAEAAFAKYVREPSPRNLTPVVRLFHEQVWHVALRVTRHPDDAADVTQEVFLGLLLSPPAAGTVRSPGGYLAFRVLTLASRRLRAAARRGKREAAVARRIAERDPNDAEAAALRQAIEGLPERIRVAVELHYLANYTCLEVARISGVSERTVAQDLQKGRDALRRRLGASCLGLLPLLASEPAPSQTAPSELLESLLKVAASGSSLAPLVSSSFLGAVLMKKLLLVAGCAILLCGSWVIVNRRALAPKRAISLHSDTVHAVAASTPTREASRSSAPVAAPPVAAPAGPAALIVADDEDGQPVPTATGTVVRESGEQAILARDGARLIVPLPVRGPDDRVVVVAAEGYFSEELRAGVLQAGETRHVTLAAVHELEIRAVTKSSRAPPKDCEVRVHRNLAFDDALLDQEPTEVLTTDSSGKAVIQNLRSTDKLHVFALDESSRLISAVEEVRAPFEELTLVLKPFDGARGRVVDQEGHPIRRARMWFHDAHDDWKVDWKSLRGYADIHRKSSPHEMDVTDERGQFVLRWPAGRRALVGVGADGYVLRLEELERGKSTDPITIVLERSALITGVVVDEEGRPAMTGASFSVAGRELASGDPVKPWRVYYHETLNVPFKFVLKDIPYGSAQSLIVEHRGRYRPKVVPLDDETRSGKRDLVVTLEPDPDKPIFVELAITPIDEVTGMYRLDPYPHVDVFRLPSEEPVPVEGNRPVTGFPWRSAVEPGTYRVEVVARGFLTAKERVEVVAGSSKPPIDDRCAEQFELTVHLKRDPSLRDELGFPELLSIEILSARDGKPPPDRAELSWRAFRLPDGAAAMKEVRRQVAQRDGAVRLRSELPPGNYQVQIDCEGLEPTTVEVSLPQGVPVIEARLEPEWKDEAAARSAIPELIRKLRHDVDGKERAMRTLVRIGPDAAPELIELLSDRNADVRSRSLAARILGSLEPPDPRCLSLLIPLLDDSAPEARRAAAEAIGDLGKEGSSALPKIVERLKDPVLRVRIGAANAIRKFGPMAVEAAGPLATLLDSEDEFVRLAATLALQAISER